MRAKLTRANSAARAKLQQGLNKHPLLGRIARAILGRTFDGGPAIRFDPTYYEITHPEARTAPTLLDHYQTIGRMEGYPPAAEFHAAAYLELYADVAQAQLDPLLHYNHSGRFENRKAIPASLPQWHWASAAAKIRASELFDATYYLCQHPIVRDAGVDPALHYLLSGSITYSEPSPRASMQAYLAENADVRTSGANPLLHYIESGRAEKRALRSSAHEGRWVRNREASLPDDVVQLERMAGVAFFSRFAFLMSQDTELGRIADAVEDLAVREPQLKLEPLAPDVSIIIPIYGQTPFALGCLDSLARHASRYSVEIIVCDDASPAQSQSDRLAAIPWIRYLHRETNGGFIDACNWAAERARGRFVVLLNSDTRVARGWLDELIGSFSLLPKAGLVGSKLFNPDLSLQEAGGIFWSDGSARNYGRGDDPNHPRYCFARRVDYCSGAAIAIPTAIWREVGGFDPEYRPAYCEDVDLAFKIRAQGYEAWYQPLARVIHYEGKTHGRDVTKGLKAYQVANMKKIAARWQNELAGHGTFGPDIHDRADRAAKQRILIVDSVNPAPDLDSGSVVTMQMIRAYQELGLQVTFLAQSSYAFDPRFGTVLQRSGVECLYAPYVRDIDEVLDERSSYDFVLVYRVTVAAEIFDTLRQRLPRAAILFHNIDLHYLREIREATIYRSTAGLRRAAETQRIELGIIARADCAIVTTAAETREIQAQLPRPITTIVEMPICVEVNKSGVPFSERHDIIFLAGFAHPPNIDAACFFVREVWPLLCDRLPSDARVLIVGSNPSEQVKALATERIVVTGYVPELHPWFDAARVFIAPLRFGAGMKGKVIQALAHGVPSVVTGIAAEGIGLEHGRDALIVDPPAAFAEAILSIYSNEQRWCAVQQSGYDFVAQHFSNDVGRELCRRTLEVAAKAWTQRQEARRARELAEILDLDSGATAIETRLRVRDTGPQATSTN